MVLFLPYKTFNYLICKHQITYSCCLFKITFRPYGDLEKLELFLAINILSLMGQFRRNEIFIEYEIPVNLKFRRNGMLLTIQVCSLQLA